MNDEFFRQIEDSTILLGEDAEKFFQSELGKYVLESALEEINFAVKELKNIDPFDSKGVMKLQTKIRVAEAAPRWLQDAIRSGRDRLESRQRLEEEY